MKTVIFILIAFGVVGLAFVGWVVWALDSLDKALSDDSDTDCDWGRE